MLALLLLLQGPGATCADLADCRAQAQAAAAHGDYETFHDLAWRAVQKAKPNDAGLMFLLARAQALSGRPGDALVMLGRIADVTAWSNRSLDSTTDALTSDDFRVVRLLPGWPTVEARLTARPAPASPAPRVASAPALEPSASPGAPEALTFEAPGLEARGFARDAVSRRFVVGDRRAHRLIVIDEVSRHVVNYVGAASAGFYDEVTALTIDARRGDLWVVSANQDSAGPSSVLHKLQLVSGRALLEVRTPERTAPVQLVDVTVTPGGVVYALDAVDSRIFRLRPGARVLESVIRLEARQARALTAAGDGVLYVAAETGLIRVDLAARSAAAVTSAEDLTRFDSLSWRAGSVYGVERAASSFLIVRIALDPFGRRAQTRQVLAASADATVGALAGDAYYYLAGPGVIRRLALR